MLMRRIRSERGQAAAEYLGIILVVVAIIGAIVASGIGGTIQRNIESAICSIAGSGCDSTGTASSGSPGGSRGSGGPGVPGAAVVPPVNPSRGGGGSRDGAGSGPGRGSPTDRGPDGRNGPNGERPGSPGGTGPSPQGGGPGSQAPDSGVELGPDGGPVPDPFDPPAPDTGSGEYDSESPGVRDRLNKQKWYLAADAAEALGYPDAARNLRHYLGNSGEPLNVNVDSILDQEQTARETAGNLVNLAASQALAAYDGSGPVDIPFRTGWRGFTANGKNWFYGLGSMSQSVTGTVHIEPGSPPKVTVTYRVHVHDRYNWDGDKSTDIGPFNIKDKELQKLHRKGLAQEYDVNGTSDEITVTVDPNNPSATTPSAGGSRDGSRGDPGRSRG